MSSPDLPAEGDIQPGRIIRIQKYGAFCSLENYNRLQGLIHISELTNFRVENVEDVVRVGDGVWVKVLRIQEDPNTNQLRIQLSLKNVAQDGSGLDLGKQQDEQRNQLELNLNSMIGMAVARDPMADQRLVMKNARTASTTTFRGGYTLVGDTDGEPEKPLREPGLSNSNTVIHLPAAGRGRGMTLPAWMTAKDGPTGLGTTAEKGEENHREKKKHKRHSTSHKKQHKRSGEKRKKKRYSGESVETSDNSAGPSPRKRRRGISREKESEARKSNKKAKRYGGSTSGMSRRDSSTGVKTWSKVDEEKSARGKHREGWKVGRHGKCDGGSSDERGKNLERERHGNRGDRTRQRVRGGEHGEAIDTRRIHRRSGRNRRDRSQSYESDRSGSNMDT